MVEAPLIGNVNEIIGLACEPCNWSMLMSPLGPLPHAYLLKWHSSSDDNHNRGITFWTY
jgi:hypothetical protein